MKKRIFLLDKIIDTRSGQLKLSIFLFLFVFATTFPKYIEILNDGSPLTTYAYFFEKIEHPLSPSILGEEKTHGAKIAFRLTSPLIAKITGTHLIGNGKGVVLVYILQSMLLLPFFFLLIRTSQRLVDNRTTFFLVISFSAVYATTAFFWDYDFWFDGYAYFFLMLSIYLRNKAGIFISSQLACWTDERAVIALYSVYIFHALQENNFNISHLYEILKIDFKNNSSILLVSALVYAAIRISFTYFFNLNTPLGAGADAGFDLIPYQISYRYLGILMSFEGLWVIFFASLLVLFSQRNIFLALVLISIVCIHILVAYSVFDITRSLSYSFPVFIISTAILSKNKPVSNHSLFALAAIICLLIPTQFLIFFPRSIPWTIFSNQEIKIVVKNLIYNF